MLFERDLDVEPYQSMLSQQSDITKARFYDEFVGIASSENAWKSSKRLSALPTPPATPEHLTSCSDVESSQQRISHGAKSISWMAQQTVGSNCLQVVPESIPDESCAQDIIPWLSACGHAENDPNNNKVPCGSSISTTGSTYSTESFRFDHPQLLSPRCSPGKEFAYAVELQQGPAHEDPYAGVSGYASHQDQRYEKPRPLVSPARDMVPECMISPLSPLRVVRRPFYPPDAPDIPSSSAMHLNHVSRDLFAHDYGDFHATQSSRPAQEQYYRQLAFERLRAQCNSEIVEDSGTQCEPELSRATHNVLERQRRNDLKLRFNLLRDTIPELMNNEKAPKIQILKKSLEYLADLKSQEQRLQADLELEKQRKLILIRRLHVLRQEMFRY